MRLAQLVLTVATLAFSPAAQAQIITLSNPSAFSGSETLIDFQGAGTNSGDPVASFGGVNFELSSGIPAFFFTDFTSREFGPTESSSIDNFDAGSAPFPDLTMVFSGPNNRLAFEMRTNLGDDIQVSLFSGATFVDTVTFTTQGSGQFFFYGLESTSDFDTAVIDVIANTNGAFRMDNLRFEATAVPEPSTFALLGLGAVGAAIAYRRRRNAVTSAPSV